jgi:hypothetical protein
VRIFDTFTKRQKKAAQAGQPDVYQYDSFPAAFRNQVTFILHRAVGPYITRTDSVSDLSFDQLESAIRHGQIPGDGRLSEYAWDLIRQILREETGSQDIGREDEDSLERCFWFFVQADADGVRDFIDVAFKVVDRIMRHAPGHYRRMHGISEVADDAIRDLNTRFQEHGIGYQFDGGQLLRVDEQYVHSQVVKPALTLLSDPAFAGPLQEFLSAHRHYRRHESKDAIVDAGNAVESTLKTICGLRGWTFPAHATASPLIEILVNNGLLENYCQSVLMALPTLRNKTAGAHGQIKSRKCCKSARTPMVGQTAVSVTSWDARSRCHCRNSPMSR